MAKLIEDYNLAVLYPDIAKEWHPTKNGVNNGVNFLIGFQKYCDDFKKFIIFIKKYI